MKVTALDLPGLLLIEPERIGDARGWFSEVWQEQRYRDAGIAEHFVQDNLATSHHGVLRGLHAQEPFAQGKLVQVLSGRVFDVAVDARVGSPTFGQWHGLFLDGDAALQYYVPPGFLHGYCVVSEQAMIGYKTTDIYSPEHQFAVRWDDPAIGVDWPLRSAPILSAKDAAAPLLADLPAARLSRY